MGSFRLSVLCRSSLYVIIPLSPTVCQCLLTMRCFPALLPPPSNIATSCITTFLAPYRGHSGPSGPKSQKSRKNVAGASRPRGQKRLKKSRKKVKNESKTTFFRLFQPFLNFFQPFLTLGPRGPGNMFSTFLGFRARMTPVRGQEGCNSCSDLLHALAFQALTLLDLIASVYFAGSGAAALSKHAAAFWEGGCSLLG